MERGQVKEVAAPSEDPAELPALAMSRPAEAEASARRLLGGRPDARTRTYCYHALGIVARDAGHLTAGIAWLRKGLHLAEEHNLLDRAADIGATLGTALVLCGRVADGERAFETALSRCSGLAAARVRMRRGTVLRRATGRVDIAFAEYRAALPVFRRHGDLIWEARTLYNRGNTWMAAGSYARAEADLSHGEAIFTRLDRPYDAGIARHNRAEIAWLRGDVPEALAHLDAARGLLASAGFEVPEVYADRATALLVAGLTEDASRAASRALEVLPARGGSSVRRAHALLQAASAAAAAGDPEVAADRAQEAGRLYSRVGNEREAGRAALQVARARYLAGRHDAHALRRTATLATDPALDPVDRVEAHLLSARLALAEGDATTALHHLGIAARARSGSSALTRARGWLAEALRAEVRGDRRGLLRACEHGLAVLDEHRLTLGATEMRAAATAHGAELAELGLRHALAGGDPDALFAWSERWRATALSVPPVRPPDDRELAEDLAALRDVSRRIAEARAAGRSTAGMEGEQSALEESARARTLRTRGDGATSLARTAPDELRARLGRTTLVELVAVDGDLHVLVVDEAGIRQFPAGTMDAAGREVELARFALHRIARPAGTGAGRSGAGRTGATLAAAATSSLATSAGRLERLLLGESTASLTDGPVVVVPPGRLHAVPWGLLPSLQHRDVTVAPSAAVWLRGRGADPPPDRNVTLVCGPDLGTGGAEVPALAAAYGTARPLAGDAATAEAVLAALDGAWLGHVAAHGDFRADNPMFSALRMADGPLTVHDMCRVRRAPYRLVLSSCESGLSATAGADELLGLASALVPLGTVGLLASVVPVADEATVPLMLDLHAALRRGATLGEALRDARRAAYEAAEPLASATAAAFVALGSA